MAKYIGMIALRRIFVMGCARAIIKIMNIKNGSTIAVCLGGGLISLAPLEISKWKLHVGLSCA